MIPLILMNIAFAVLFCFSNQSQNLSEPSHSAILILNLELVDRLGLKMSELHFVHFHAPKYSSFCPYSKKQHSAVFMYNENDQIQKITARKHSLHIWFAVHFTCSSTKTAVMLLPSCTLITAVTQLCMRRTTQMWWHSRDWKRVVLKQKHLQPITLGYE